MVIGLKYGRTRAEDVETRDRAYTVVREFVDEFQTRNGSIVCRELLGFDIRTAEGLALASEKYLDICPGFVQDAAEIIEQVLVQT